MYSNYLAYARKVSELRTAKMSLRARLEIAPELSTFPLVY